MPDIFLNIIKSALLKCIFNLLNFSVNYYFRYKKFRFFYSVSAKPTLSAKRFASVLYR